MIERRRKRFPFWLRRLDQVREGQQPIHAKLGIGERLDLAMMLMAEGLAQLKERVRKEAKGQRADPEAVDRLLRRFARLDQRWVKAKRG